MADAEVYGRKDTNLEGRVEHQCRGSGQGGN